MLTRTIKKIIRKISSETNCKAKNVEMKLDNKNDLIFIFHIGNNQIIHLNVPVIDILFKNGYMPSTDDKDRDNLAEELISMFKYQYHETVYWSKFDPTFYYPDTIFSMDIYEQCAYFRLNEFISVQMSINEKGKIVECFVHFGDVYVDIDIEKYRKHSLENIFSVYDSKTENLITDLKTDLFQILVSIKSNNYIYTWLERNEEDQIKKLKATLSSPGYKSSFKNIKITFKN